MSSKKHAVEDLMSGLLRRGVFLSGSFILIGWALSLWETTTGDLHHQQVWQDLLSGQSQLSFSVEELKLSLLQSHLRFNSSAWIVVGLLVLLWIPILRVMLSAWAFYREKDYLFLLFSCVVLSMLLGSLFLGRGGH